MAKKRKKPAEEGAPGTSEASVRQGSAEEKRPAAARAPGEEKAPREEPAAAPEHRLTAQRHDGSERRAEERHDVPGLIRVEIEMFGYQRDGREFGVGPAPDPRRKIHTSGSTINLSFGGMLAEVADAITPGSHCLVRFIDAGAGLRPALRWALVLRCEEAAAGHFEIAVRFDSPLEHLDLDEIIED